MHMFSFAFMIPVVMATTAADDVRQGGFVISLGAIWNVIFTENEYHYVVLEGVTEI